MTETHEAYIEMIDALRELPDSFLDDFKDLSPKSQLKGYRHLAHLLSYGFDFYLESDPLRPKFVPLALPSRKILGDNTDSIYCFTQIRAGERYRIWGRRGDACYLSFSAYAGESDGSWSDGVALNINHRDIEFDADGRFEILVGPDAPTGPNQFQLEERSVCLITREYYMDRAQQALAEFHIENTSDVPSPQADDDQTLADKLRAVTNFVSQTCALIPQPASDEPNQLDEPFAFETDQMGWGTPDNIYAMGTFKLADDEVMVIEGRSPECVYWGVQTWNMYMQSLEWRYHQVSQNSSQIILNDDGSWTVYVAKADPGLGNFVGTAGEGEGIVFCRWLLSDSMPETPACRVVKRASLA